MPHEEAHKTGLCPKCKKRVRFCDACGVPIPKGGDCYGEEEEVE